MTKTWFTSDLHWGHRLVAEKRGFASTIDHDVALAARWEEVVGKKDHVWVLGDLAVSSPTYALACMEMLPGIKHLVWGNHGQGHPMHRSAYKHQRRYLDVFASVQASARRRIDGVEVLLSHYPYDGDHKPYDRDVQWRLRDYGVPLLHGHVHSTERVTWSMRRPSPTLQVHVGVDAWDLTPVPMHQVSALLTYALAGDPV